MAPARSFFSSSSNAYAALSGTSATSANTREQLAFAGRGLLGFAVTVLVWSIFVGDWSATSRDASLSTTQLGPTHALVPDAGGSAVGAPVWPGWSGVRDVIVFGDSLSTTRFHYQGARPSWSNPFGNTDTPSIHANGEPPKWIEYLHSDYNASYFRVTNFASPGSTVERHFWQPRPQGAAPSPDRNTLKEQIGLFKGSYTIAKTQPFEDWAANSSLFAMWFGANEILDEVRKERRLPMDAVFATYHGSIERLYALGGRTFLLLNLPPLDAVLTRPWPGTADPTRDIDTFNAHLSRLASRTRRRHPDTTIFEFDVHALWSAALRKPDAFETTRRLRETRKWCEAYAKGFTTREDKKEMEKEEREHDESCAFARDEYFWMDDHRPSHVVQMLTAEILARDCFGREGAVGYCTDKD